MKLFSVVAVLVSTALAQECEIDCQPSEGCSASQLDLVFSLDESGSMYWENFMGSNDNVNFTVNRFVESVTFVQKLKFGITERYNQAKFGLSAWSQQCNPPPAGSGAAYDNCCYDYGDYTCSRTMPPSRLEKQIFLPGKRTVFDVRGADSNPGQVATIEEALGDIFPVGRTTQVEWGFSACKDQLMPCRRDALGACVQRICMVISDGSATGNIATANANANELKNDDVTIITVGIGTDFNSGSARSNMLGWSSGSQYAFTATGFDTDSLDILLAEITASVTCFALDILPAYTCQPAGSSSLRVTGDSLNTGTGLLCRFFRGTSQGSASAETTATGVTASQADCPVPALTTEFFATTYFIEVSKNNGQSWTTNRNRIQIAADVPSCAAATNEPFDDDAVEDDALPTTPPTDKSQLGQVGGGGGADQPGVNPVGSGVGVGAAPTMMFAALLGLLLF